MTARAPRLRPERLLTEWLLVGALLSVLMTVLVVSGAVRRLDDLAYDAAAMARPLPVPADVIIIGIDEASLARIGPWPWPRDVHAAAIDRLVAGGVRAIGYDVLFVEPAAGDAALAAALRRTGQVTLPMQFRVPGHDGLAYDALLPAVGPALVGHSTVIPDADGVVRRIDLAMDGERRWLHMAALVAGVPPLPAFAPRAVNVPLAREGERLIGYRGGAGVFPSISFAALYAGEVPGEVLAGRTVMVGATAPGLGDLFSATGAGASGVMTGVELQANVVADLRQGRALRRAGPGASIALGMAALWLGMIGLLRFRPAGAALFGAAVVMLTGLTACALFARAGLWVGPAAAITVLLLAQPAWAWRRLAVVNRWMLDEIADLGQVGDQAGGKPDSAPADPVTRSTRLLEAAIDRVEGLRELADAAIRGLPDATLLVDRKGAIVAANTAAQGLFGPAPALAAVDACFAAAGLPAFDAAALADPASAWRGEHRAGDGSIRDIRHTPWRDSGGAPLGWIVRFADITALRRAEQAREEALQLLTHDMRAPQATILALVEREMGLDPALAGRLRHLAQRTIALADGYLQLARADAGAYAMDEIDLAAILTEAVDELWPQSQASGVRLVGEGLEDEALMRGNHQLLLRAAVNLIGNAVKFAPPGSDVTVRLAGDPPGWRFDVTDTGPGISAAVQARLFGRFRTGPQAAGTSGGVGLGLAFVRSVADGHGGTVTCRSTEGEGATFSLWLPKGRSGGDEPVDGSSGEAGEGLVPFAPRL